MQEILNSDSVDEALVKVLQNSDEGFDKTDFVHEMARCTIEMRNLLASTERDIPPNESKEKTAKRMKMQATYLGAVSVLSSRWLRELLKLMLGKEA